MQSGPAWGRIPLDQDEFGAEVFLPCLAQERCYEDVHAMQQVSTMIVVSGRYDETDIGLIETH